MLCTKEEIKMKQMDMSDMRFSSVFVSYSIFLTVKQSFLTIGRQKATANCGYIILKTNSVYVKA